LDDSYLLIRRPDAFRQIPNIGAPGTLMVHIALSEYDMTETSKVFSCATHP
jgi:hypothetical protein